MSQKECAPAQVAQEELGIWAEDEGAFRPLFGTQMIAPEGDEDEESACPATVKAVELVAGKLGTAGVASCVAVGCRVAGAAFLAHIGCIESFEVFKPAMLGFLAASAGPQEWFLYNGLVFDDSFLPEVQAFLQQHAAGPFRVYALDAGCGDFAFDVGTGEPFLPVDGMKFERTAHGGSSLA